MLEIKVFTFGPFQENTYLLFDENNDCIIFDPGCFGDTEKQELATFIEQKKLKPVRLINTHGHIDHVAANKFVSEKYDLGVEINEHDLEMLNNVEQTARMYGLYVEPSPTPQNFLNEGDTILLGKHELEITHTPGHSPGSLCFTNKVQKFIIAGDVLFQGSIGRTDLPGGNYDQLINSIKTKLFILKDEFRVFPGHGPETTIGFEKTHNPFLS